MAKEKKIKTVKTAKTKEVAKVSPAITLSNLSPAPGSHHRRKIVGRGVGSGHGRHATRGMKGQRSRSGDGKMIGFEGGQMTLLRRIPKRGFSPPFQKQISIVNVEVLNHAFKAGSEVTPAALYELGLVKKDWRVKILGTGEIKKALKVHAHLFSKQAKEKIASSGGSAELLPL